MAAYSVWRMEMDTRRRGLFWDVLAGRVPPPPAAVLLGWELVAVDPEQGTIEVAFQAGENLANPVGVIQGGFLAAMLDDTLGPALVATLPENQFAPTLDLHVQFLRPARPGRLLGRGRIVQRGKEVCFLAGDLMGPDGKPVAVATATARIQTVR
ncbi:PaaI family thioesterase [Nonomuraea africana]